MYGSSMTPARTTNSWPVILRWIVIAEPSSRVEHDELAAPRRPDDRAGRATAATNAAGSPRAQRLRPVARATPVIRAPTTSPRRSRATVSTSGSSGIRPPRSAATASTGASSASASAASIRETGVIDSQSSPTLTSTVSGTSSGSAPSIVSRTTGASRSTSSRGDLEQQLVVDREEQPGARAPSAEPLVRAGSWRS